MEFKVLFWFVSKSPGLSYQTDEYRRSHVSVIVDFRVVFCQFWLTTSQISHVKRLKNLWKCLVFSGIFVQGLDRYRPQFSNRNCTGFSAIIFFSLNFFTNKWEFICFTLNWGFGGVFCWFVGWFPGFGVIFEFVYLFRDASFHSFHWGKLTLTRFVADCLPDRLFIPGLSLTFVKDDFPHYHPELWMILFIKMGKLVLNSFIVDYTLVTTRVWRSQSLRRMRKEKKLCEPMK